MGIALELLTKIDELIPRLDDKQKSPLLQILDKRIIVTHDGEIIGYELNSPFVYFRSIVDVISNP